MLNNKWFEQKNLNTIGLLVSFTAAIETGFLINLLQVNKEPKTEDS